MTLPEVSPLLSAIVMVEVPVLVMPVSAGVPTSLRFVLADVSCFVQLQSGAASSGAGLLVEHAADPHAAHHEQGESEDTRRRCADLPLPAFLLRTPGQLPV